MSKDQTAMPPGAWRWTTGDGVEWEIFNSRGQRLIGFGPLTREQAIAICYKKNVLGVTKDEIYRETSNGGPTPRSQANAIMTDPANRLYAKYQSGDADTVTLVNSLLIQA